MFRKTITFITALAILMSMLTFTIHASSADENLENDINNGAEEDIIGATNLEISAKSAVLMDAETGTVLFSKNPNEALAPASVTKVMTLLLIAEALADERITLEEKVTVSANAMEMGGSQIFLKEGEEFTVEELLKSTIIASANDAAVALAELVAGTEGAFVAKMNERAEELGMKSTTFENCTGLDDTVTKHLTSAYDIALMSRELIKHPIILKYSNVWQDSIRGGEFVLTNTNRLVRYYSGCTGLKTGSTDKAGFCVSATAERDGMHLIAVIMGSSTREERNNAARTLLDYGFSSYAVYSDPESELEYIDVKKSTVDKAPVFSSAFSILVPKGDLKKIEKKYDIPESIYAPIEAGGVIGKVTYLLDGKEIGCSDVFIKDEVPPINYFDTVLMLLSEIIVGRS